jgi:hypothetical protein
MSAFRDALARRHRDDARDRRGRAPARDRVHDHIVVGNDGHASLKELKLM